MEESASLPGKASMATGRPSPSHRGPNSICGSPRLPLEEPILADVFRQAELGVERRGGRLRPEAPGGGELRSRLQDPLGDHGGCEVPLWRAPRGDRLLDPAGAQGREDRGGIPVRQRPGDPERAVEPAAGRVGEDGALQDGADFLDRFGGRLVMLARVRFLTLRPSR